MTTPPTRPTPASNSPFSDIDPDVPDPKGKAVLPGVDPTNAGVTDRPIDDIELPAAGTVAGGTATGR
jgi:hypothetical protein